jgi:hypothetical protein
MKRITILLAVTLLAVIPISAQVVVSSDTKAAIQGSKNPELVPDSVVYRHWFSEIAWAVNNEAKFPGMTAGCMALAGFNDVDRSVLIGVAMTWDTTVRKMDADYNANPKHAAGTMTSAEVYAYSQKRAKYTLDMAAVVKAGLSVDGLALFKPLTQSRKASISMDKGAI